METAQIEADVALLRVELANLGADLASEAANVQVAIRRAESADNTALPVNDATWMENFRSGVVHSPGVQSAAGDSRQRRLAFGLLGDEMPGCE